MGVIKVEMPVFGTEPPPSEFVTKLGNALLAERTVTPHGLDRRWHAHLYPVFQAERCVKNTFVSSAILRAVNNALSDCPGRRRYERDACVDERTSAAPGRRRGAVRL